MGAVFPETQLVRESTSKCQHFSTCIPPLQHERPSETMLLLGGPLLSTGSWAGDAGVKFRQLGDPDWPEAALG